MRVIPGVLCGHMGHPMSRKWVTEPEGKDMHSAARKALCGPPWLRPMTSTAQPSRVVRARAEAVRALTGTMMVMAARGRFRRSASASPAAKG